MNAAVMRLNERPMRGFTYDSGTASSVSTSAEIGTDSRQKSSARSTRPSAATRIARRNRLGRDRQVAQLGRLDPAAELLEFDDPVFGRPRLAFVAPAVGQDDEAVAVGGFLEHALAGHRRHVLAFLDRVQEDVADVAVEGIDAVDVDDEVGPAKFAKKPRHDEGELVLRLQLALVFDPPLLRPGREKKRKYDDGEKNGAANQSTGRITLARPWPEVNQTIISLSRYQRDSVRSTVRNTVTDSKMLK